MSGPQPADGGSEKAKTNSVSLVPFGETSKMIAPGAGFIGPPQTPGTIGAVGAAGAGAGGAAAGADAAAGAAAPPGSVGASARAGKRPASLAISPPLATVTCPAFAHGTSCFHSWMTARCSRMA